MDNFDPKSVKRFDPNQIKPFTMPYLERKEALRKQLSENLQKQIEELRSLYETVSSRFAYEDRMYRFYHHSFKVYDLQDYTLKMVEAFQKLLPGETLNADFLRMVELGTGKEFDVSVNANWFEETVWITNAFLHARYFLDMIVKTVTEYQSGRGSLSYPEASTLHLFNLR